MNTFIYPRTVILGLTDEQKKYWKYIKLHFKFKSMCKTYIDGYNQVFVDYDNIRFRITESMVIEIIPSGNYTFEYKNEKAKIIIDIIKKYYPDFYE